MGSAGCPGLMMLHNTLDVLSCLIALSNFVPAVNGVLWVILLVLWLMRF